MLICNIDRRRESNHSLGCSIADKPAVTSNAKSRHHDRVFARVAERDFLKFSGALAADAVARLERRNVADVAIVSDFVKLAVPYGKKVSDLEGAVRFHCALDADFATQQALILQGVR
jgi:hypothetical protein